MKQFSAMALMALALCFATLLSCNNSSTVHTKTADAQDDDAIHSPGVDTVSKMITDTTPLKEVPILCYHQVRSLKPGDGPYSKAYTVSPETFASQMQTLHDSGYTSILPNDLYEYLQHRKKLPEKPVMISFDDGSIGQYTEALPQLDKYGFKAVFFIMTVSINHKGYMSAGQIKTLLSSGHDIENHTYDHHPVNKYLPADWEIQLGKSETKLESITGYKPQYFAYPYGVWDKTACDSLQGRGYKLAFILGTSNDPEKPFYTIRRLTMGWGNSPATMLRNMKGQFH